MAVSSSLNLMHNSRKLVVMATTKAENDPVQCFPTFSPPSPPPQDVVITPLDAVQFAIARRCQAQKNSDRPFHQSDLSRIPFLIARLPSAKRRCAVGKSFRLLAQRKGSINDNTLISIVQGWGTSGPRAGYGP
ncbi:hypothetical protein M514_27880 [Trichuris suis]|uniref:Uncharacterized protein n=1 Tax=Trichuris suis TaxID=68888 RepID=A0A085MRV1_9BILA|nr:hypothetical protein M514_27880 [Trichuris suis]